MLEFGRVCMAGVRLWGGAPAARTRRYSLQTTPSQTTSCRAAEELTKQCATELQILATAGKLAAPRDAARAPVDLRRARPRTRHAATITELCNSEVLPEVEIVSLLQERIPKYRLRADSLTQFGGYENQDWFIPSPALKVADADLKLSPDQIRETLNYFLLCSNRVSQMTKTYNDIEAVTRLLEEKEKDLELTARIGKELLSANARLESRAAALDAELRAARDEATQLQHQLHAKSDLLQVLTDDTEDGEAGLDAECGGTAELLQRRAGALERENRALRDEASRLAAGADRAEQDERRLLRDIAQQLASANSEANSMGTELMSERERVLELTDQLLATTQRMQQTERALNQLKHEHEHTLQILEITRENQNALASELGDSKDRYNELAAHLAEAQEQLRRLREKPTARGGALMPYVAAAAGLHHDSLHAELHSSLYSDLSLDSGIFDPARGSNVKKVFETVAYASRWTGSSAHSGAASVDSGAGGGDGFKTRMTHSIADSVIDNVSEADLEELYPGGIGGCGVPGVPGAAELAEALQRLTPADVASRRATLSSAPLYDGGRESAVWGVGGPGAWRLPSRLQIVKPMEGSQTLGHWAQLAKPTMSGLLEERVGVGVRGGRSAAQLGLAVYSLSDLEEDDELPRFPHASHVTTITNSMVMHPDDGSMCGSVMSSNVSSVMGSAWSSLASSRRTSAMPSAVHSPCATPRLLSRRNSTAAGLPPRVVFSPTATPANSPMLGSPSDSPPPTPTATAPSLTSLIASGTDILRRTFLSPGREPHSPASPSPLALHTPGSLYAGLAHRSPMEQLTCLKRTLYPGVRQRPPEPATPTIREEESALGVPAAPGCGALERGVRRRTARVPRPRGDLGTVGAAQPAVHTTALGTLSTLLFGRKGGLL